jgi:hypothetical protein
MENQLLKDELKKTKHLLLAKVKQNEFLTTKLALNVEVNSVNESERRKFSKCLCDQMALSDIFSLYFH